MAVVFLVVLIVIFIGAFAFFFNNYNKFKRVPSRGNMTGYDAANLVNTKYNLENSIIEKKGSFTDTFDYKKKVIKLSSLVFHQATVYSQAMGYYIAMQVVMDQDRECLIKYKKQVEPYYYILIAASYFGIVLLAFSTINYGYLIGTLTMCVMYQLTFFRTDLDVIERVKREFVGEDTNLSKALDNLALLNLAFGVLYIRVLVDKLVELVKGH